MLALLEKGVDTLFSLIPQPMPEKKIIELCKIIAHRGAHDQAEKIIENTMAAFDKAAEVGCDGIELDIHSTRDHVIVVHHDPDLKRLWGLDKYIAELDFETLRELVPEIPSLEEVVLKYGQKLHLYIELKAPFSDYEVLIKELESLKPGIDFHLISLDDSLLPPLSGHYDKSVLLLVSDFGDTRKYCQLSIEQGYGGVMGHYLLFNQACLQRLMTAGQKIGVGFVDSEQSLKREINRGIGWLFTNKAEKVCAVRDKLLDCKAQQ